MLAVCGMENGPVHVLGQPAVNPAAQFVASTGFNDPMELLNVSIDDFPIMVKDHHQRGAHIVPVTTVVAKNI